METHTTLQHLIIAFILLYIIASFVILIRTFIEDPQFEFTIGSMIFPVYFIPFFFKLIFCYKIIDLWRYLHRTKHTCKCPICGTGHPTYKDQFMKVVNK